MNGQLWKWPKRKRLWPTELNAKQQMSECSTHYLFHSGLKLDFLRSCQLLLCCCLLRLTQSPSLSRGRNTYFVSTKNYSVLLKPRRGRHDSDGVRALHDSDGVRELHGTWSCRKLFIFCRLRSQYRHSDESACLPCLGESATGMQLSRHLSLCAV